VPFFFFIFWGILILVLGGGWLASGIVLLRTRKRKGSTKWVAGSVFACFSLVIAVIGFGFGYDHYRSSVPSLVFEDTFHEKLPPGTVALHGKRSGFMDSAGTELVFRTDRASFDRLRSPDLERFSLEHY
jgi:hypothetical protein